MIPAPPIPQMARPTMKVTELGAAPQRAEAASNRKVLVRRTALTEKKV